MSDRLQLAPGVWLCRVCGEVIFSAGQPTRCPACGAFQRFLVEPGGLEGILARDQGLPPALEAGARRILDQEVDTAELYSRVAACSRHPLFRETFRALQRIEARHAGLLAAAFKLRKGISSYQPDLSGKTEKQLLEAVRARESGTIAIYESLLPSVAGTELEVVFRALIEIESDHNALADRLEPLADTWPPTAP